MFDREKYIAAHFQSDFFLALRFRVISEIERSQRGEAGYWKDHESIVEEVAQGIVEGQWTRYNLTDDYITEHYGIEDYADIQLLSDLSFYHAGCIAQIKGIEPTLDYFEQIEENMDGGFFMGYKPLEEDLKRLVISLDGRAIEVASRSRDINRQEGALERFCKELDKVTDEDGLIAKINHFNDGSYMEVWGAVRCLTHYLIVDGLWELLVELLGKLKYFPLQGGLIKLFLSPKDVESVVVGLRKGDNRKSIHYLLREQWFRLICEEGRQLDHNLENDELKGEDKIFVKQIAEEFKKEKSESLKVMTEIWLDVFGKEDMAVWMSGKKMEAESKHESYGKPELIILDQIEKEVNISSDDLKAFSLENKDFSSLLTFAGSAKDEEVSVKVIEAIADNIFSERSYPDTVLKGEWFENVRTIYRCLAMSKLNGLELLRRNRKPMEGYRVNLTDAMRNVRQEAYWMAMLLISLEENGDEGLFKSYIDVLFKDTMSSVDSLTDDVFAPYYVAELLVSQVMTKQKDYYERRLIEEVPYLVFVIRVLSGNQGKMSDQVKELLKERVEKEWALERELLSQYKMVDVGYYDDFVKNVKG